MIRDEFVSVSVCKGVNVLVSRGLTKENIQLGIISLFEYVKSPDWGSLIQFGIEDLFSLCFISPEIPNPHLIKLSPTAEVISTIGDKNAHWGIYCAFMQSLCVPGCH